MGVNSPVSAPTYCASLFWIAEPDIFFSLFRAEMTFLLCFYCFYLFPSTSLRSLFTVFRWSYESVEDYHFLKTCSLLLFALIFRNLNSFNSLITLANIYFIILFTSIYATYVFLLTLFSSFSFFNFL